MAVGQETNDGKETDRRQLDSSSKSAPRRGIEGEYKRLVRHKTVFMALSLLVLILLALVAASTGSIPISFGEVVSILVRHTMEGPGRIVWDVRMPRIMAAILVGSGLALSGTVMQSVLKNPLASPYTLGISNAAAFGAAFAIVVLQAGTGNAASIVVNNPYTVAIAAFIASIIAAASILVLASLARISSESMVLAGIAIGSMFAAALTLLQFLADSVQLATIVSWTFGDLGRADWHILGMLAGVLLLVFLLFLINRWNFNAMDAGDEAAQSLGVDIRMIRVVGMLGSSLVAAVAVSCFGIISFIGLLGPHLAKRCIGGDHRHLLVVSPIFGAILLLASDTVARTILSPMVLPAGVVTAMLGGPLFIWLLVRRMGR